MKKKCYINNMKNQKIIITGGLGYIGTELCKLYSGETRYTDIIVIDNRFISERVKQLREWGFNFKQGDILDKEFMRSVLKGADVVYHLAGVTDVAYTKAEENGNSAQITEVGIQGSRNIINNISDSCKLIFPSTHVVYEGFKQAVYDISEECVLV